MSAERGFAGADLAQRPEVVGNAVRNEGRRRQNRATPEHPARVPPGGPPPCWACTGVPSTRA